MANTAQARKRARQNLAQREHNASLRSEFRTAIKRVRAAIEAGDKGAAVAVFLSASATIDSIADKKVYHKNKAARHKARLSAAIKAMSGSAPAAATKKPTAAKAAPAEKKPAAAKAPAAEKKAPAEKKAAAPKKPAAEKPAAEKKPAAPKKAAAAKKPASKKAAE